MGIEATSDREDFDAEMLEFEFHRLMSIADAYTGAEKLRQKVIKMDVTRAIDELQRFIQIENEMRGLTPYRVDEINRAVKDAADWDDFKERQ